MNSTLETSVAARLEVALRVRDKHLRPGGTVSGPSMFALADVAAYLHILSLIGPKGLSCDYELRD